MKRYLFFRLLAVTFGLLAALLLVALLAKGRPAAAALLIAATVLAVAAAALSWLLARYLARPLQGLLTAFRRVAAGELDVRVMPARRGRLRELGQSFNEMAFRTLSVVTELKQQREALDAIIGSMKEGLAVVERDGRLVLANQSFKRIAAEPSIEGRFYWEVIREPGFVELVRGVSADTPSAGGQFELAGRDYDCSANFLATAQRIVVTCHDTTEVSRVARLKRDFVQNVSHELRTPLTAIKGFAETMEPTIDKANRPYLETILRHTDRLVSLVQDLLTLSELEERGGALQLEDVSLKAVAEQVLKLFEPRARAKGLVLRLSSLLPPPSSLVVRADRFKLEQVLINLLDNAVKYTEKGEVEVVLGRDSGVERDASGAERIVIEVRDTGPGIAPEHLPRLFERFYVVDKGRSRQLGGTGLGLAIVKHIVLLHSGDVTVESTPGVGTTFKVTLPAS